VFTPSSKASATLPVNLYLFDQSRAMLETNLKVVGLSIESMIADFGAPNFKPDRGPSNNPWKAISPYGETMGQSPQAGLGYGIPLQAETADDARKLLQRFRRAARERGRPDIARIIGIDLVGTSMAGDSATQHWCAGDAMGRHFGTRRHANTLVKTDALCPPKLTGDVSLSSIEVSIKITSGILVAPMAAVSSGALVAIFNNRGKRRIHTQLRQTAMDPCFCDPLST